MKNILLVEGPDDEHVFRNLCGRHGFPRLDEVKPHGGYTALLDAIPTRTKESDIGALGIVIDADADISSRWAAVRDRLERSGYEVPRDPEKSGLVLLPPPGTLLPRVGVWIMPNNRLPGILEDFIRDLVPAGDQLYEYAQNCVDGIAPEQKRFRALDLPKVRIHTWLAWQDEPGKPLGQAITKGILDANAEKALVVVAWLKRLFLQ